MEWPWLVLSLSAFLALTYVYFLGSRRQAHTKLASALAGRATRIDTFAGGAGLATDGERLAICGPATRLQVLTGRQIRGIDFQGEPGQDWLGRPATKLRLWIAVRGRTDEPTASIVLPGEQVARDWAALIGELLEADERPDSTSTEEEPSKVPVEGPIPPGYHEIAASMRAYGFAVIHSGEKKNKPEWIISKALREYLEKDPTRRLSDLEKLPLARFLSTAFDPPPYTVGTLRTYLTRAIGELLHERTTKNSSQAPLSKS